MHFLSPGFKIWGNKINYELNPKQGNVLKHQNVTILSRLHLRDRPLMFIMQH